MPITSEPSPNTPPAGTARIRYLFSYTGGGMSTGHWALLTGTPDSAALAALATDAYGVYETNLLAFAASDVVLTECAIEYFTGGGSIAAAAFASHAGGTTDDPSLTAQTAVVISWSILDTYRGGKPRMYLPFTGSGQIDTARTYGNTFVAAATAAAASYLDDFNGLAPTGVDTCTAGVVSFFSGGAALSPPVFKPYLAGSCQKRICTQRRRLGAEI